MNYSILPTLNIQDGSQRVMFDLRTLKMVAGELCSTSDTNKSILACESRKMHRLPIQYNTWR